MNECKERRGDRYVVTYRGRMASNALASVELSHPFSSVESDEAGVIARRLNTILNHPRFPNLRGFIRHATWLRSDSVIWDIRNKAECLQELTQLDIAFEEEASTCSPVPNPVKVLNGIEINGVKFTRPLREEYLIFSCELLSRLYDMADTFKSHDIKEVFVMSHHRKGTLPHDPVATRCSGQRPSPSMHRTGLAIDILGFKLNNGSRLNVTRDFYQGLNEFNELEKETCSGEIRGSSRAQKLRRIACDLHATGLYSTILTPNYNCGHYDHFHIDIRPRDNRRFLR